MFVTRTNFNFSTLLNVSLKSNRNIRMKKKKSDIDGLSATMPTENLYLYIIFVPSIILETVIQANFS